MLRRCAEKKEEALTGRGTGDACPVAVWPSNERRWAASADHPLLVCSMPRRAGWRPLGRLGGADNLAGTGDASGAAGGGSTIGEESR